MILRNAVIALMVMLIPLQPQAKASEKVDLEYRNGQFYMAKKPAPRHRHLPSRLKIDTALERKLHSLSTSANKGARKQ